MFSSLILIIYSILSLYKKLNSKIIVLTIISVTSLIIILSKFDYTYKDIISYKIPKVEIIKNVTLEGNIIYSPLKGDQLWDANIPATPYYNPNIKIEKNIDGYYKIFWYEKK